MVKQYKIDSVQELIKKLDQKGNLIFTNFSGVKVTELSELRSNLRKNGAEYKVVKNNMFKRALKDAGYDGLDDHLKGPIGVVFTEEVGQIAKLLKEFKKEHDKFSFSLGVFDKVVYNEDQVKKIADLPSKEVLISQIMSLINSSATNIAMVMNQTIASVARGIDAVAQKNANA